MIRAACVCHHLLHSITLWEYRVINICICYIIIKTYQLVILYEMLHIYSKLRAQDYSETYLDNNMNMHIHCIDVHLCVVNTNLWQATYGTISSVRNTVDTAYHPKTRSVNIQMYKIRICCCSHQYWKLLSFSSDLIHYQGHLYKV